MATRAPKKTAEPVLGLNDYIAAVERRHLERGVVAVSVTHPDVPREDLFAGVYAGIRLLPGAAPAVTYSDGSQEQ